METSLEEKCHQLPDHEEYLWEVPIRSLEIDSRANLFRDATSRTPFNSRIIARDYNAIKYYLYNVIRQYDGTIQITLHAEMLASSRSETEEYNQILNHNDDLYAIYTTLKQRSGCQRRNPSTARDLTLNQLERTDRSYADRRPLFTLDVLKLYVYLLLNAEVMELPVQSQHFNVPLQERDLIVATATNPFVQRLVNETQRLYRLVSQKIASLP